MEQKYTVVVDYSRRIKNYILSEEYGVSLINDAIINETVTHRSGTAIVEISLIHFKPMKTTEEILSELEALKIRSTEIHELIALGVQNPEVAKFRVMTFGNKYSGGSFPHLQPGLVVGLIHPYDPMHSHLFDVATGRWKTDLWVAVTEKEKSKQNIA